MMSFPSNLRRARAQYQLTLRELAERVGVSHQSIKKYEDGVMYPSSSVLVRIGAVLGVSIDDLMSADDRNALAQTGRRAAVLAMVSVALATLERAQRDALQGGLVGDEFAALAEAMIALRKIEEAA